MPANAQKAHEPGKQLFGIYGLNDIAWCVLVAILLPLSSYFLSGPNWHGGFELHTELEELSAVLALIIGAMALVRYYGQRDGLLLLVGAGFLGAGMLDACNTIYTSKFYIQSMPSDSSALIAWGWVASRWFLSMFLLASAIVWRGELRHHINTKSGEFIVFSSVALIVAGCVTGFAVMPLPAAYFDDMDIHRPEELLPALLFLLALIGFATSKNWTKKPTEYWLVMCLIISTGIQLCFMPYSSKVYDLEFDVAYTLKIVSYFCVLIGLLADMRDNFSQLSESKLQIKQQALLLTSVLENIDEGISHYDSDLRITLFNANYLEMQGIPHGKFDIGDNLEDIFRYRAECGEYGAGEVEEIVRQKSDLARAFEPHKYEHTRPNGQIIMVTGNPVGGNSMVASYRNVTERVQHERQLLASEQTLQSRVCELEELKRALEDKTKYAMNVAEDLRQAKNVQHDAIQNISEGFVLWDADDKLVMCNDVFRQLFAGLKDDIEPGLSFETFISLAYQRGILVKEEEKELAETVTNRLKLHHQSIVPFDEMLSEGRWIRVSERHTSDRRIVGIITDITDQKDWESKMKKLAETDALTGLPNRTLFQERLQQAIDQAERLETLVAVMLLDLDRFKDINDTMGHPSGDELLIQVSERLIECGRKTDTIARLGGDEFAVIATNLNSPFDAEYLARRIVETLGTPFSLSKNEVHTATSIGISFYPQDDIGTDELIRNADIALYQAKAEGGSVYRLYDAEIDCEVQARQKLERELRRAIEDNQFLLAYQPQFDIKSGRMIGAEALLRWEHPERGLVSPGKFIEVAESSRLIIPISEWVLREACQFNNRLHESGLAEITVSINISPLHFRQQGLYQSVSDAIEEAGVSPASVELEITESMAMAHRGNVIDLLNDLKKLGVGLAIDDFGTGFSSLSRLKDFPVDRLKVDRSFIIDLTEDKDHRAISSAIIRLGHSLGLKVIAEGVEKPAHLDALAEMGCDEAQGFLFARPLPEKDFVDFLQDSKSGTAAA